MTQSAAEKVSPVRTSESQRECSAVAGSGNITLPRRPIATTPELDDAELEWWERFGDLEEDYCWVQPDRVRHYLRKGYVKRMLSFLQSGASVVELGCGSGWLSVLLAQSGARQVLGLDFSAEQVRRARGRARNAGVSDTATFCLAESASMSQASDVRRDAVLCHGFLHHLSWTEIWQVLSDAHGLLAPGGLLFVIEPVLGTARTPRWLRFLASLPFVVAQSRWKGLRRFSREEILIRQRIEQRSEGSKYGAPKESPFLPGQLEAIAHPLFALHAMEPVLWKSVGVARQVLLMRHTYPRLAGLLEPLLLRYAKAVERLSLRMMPSGGWRDDWTFYLYVMETRTSSCPSTAIGACCRFAEAADETQ